MKKTVLFLSLAIVFALGCKNDDPEPETKKQIIYDTTKVVDRYVDSIYHHFYDTTHVKFTDSIYHHFYDTLIVQDTVRVPILCDHSWVIYNLNNGTDETDTLDVKNGTFINLKSDVSRSGYDLVKWNSSPTGNGSDYQVGENYQVVQDVTFYAVWQSREGLRSNELYDFLSKQANGATVDAKIIDLTPDYTEIKRALDKFWKVKVNLDLGEATQAFYLGSFANCTNLVSIKLPPNLEYVGSSFQGCTGLTKLEIPLHVTKLELTDCANLTVISMSDGLLEVSIKSCPKLTSVNLPQSLKKLSLSYLDNLKTVSIPDGVTELGSFCNCPLLTEITIPESVESAELDFSGCTSLKTVKHSLKECSGVNFKNCSSLTSIILPEFRPDHSYLDNEAFWECSSLKSIIIPDGITSIGNFTFHSCSNLTSVSIPESVISIGNSSFSYCTSLTSITIPKNVRNIGSGAFTYCTSLKSLSIPDGVTSIYLETCTNLSSITIPQSVTSLSLRDFPNLQSITIPDNVSVLSLSELSALSSIIIPENVTELYLSCSLLSSVTIPKNVTKLSLYECKALSSVLIPEKTTSISLQFCSNLTSITIPESVVEMRSAFYGCSKLVSVTLKKTSPPILDGWIDYYGTIYVPSSAVDAYKTANFWEDHASQIEGY